MPIRSWRFHLGRLAFATAAVTVFGFAIGHPLKVLLAGALGYLAWNLYNGWKLYRWLGSDETDPPESRGLWADIFDQINTLRQRTQRQNLQYEAVISEFQSMTDAFPDATLVIDAQDTITWFNDAARRLLGLRIPEDLGQPVTNLLRDPDFANWLSVQDKVQSSLEMESPLDEHVQLSLSAVHYREGQRLLILRDVTELRNVERVRRDFVANVSHELRTPLTVLLGYLEAMQDQADATLEPAISRMRAQARQMQALLDDLLELSRLQNDRNVGQEEPVDVPAMLAQLKEQAEELSGGHHQLVFEVDPLLNLRGIPADLESAFRNLIVNAIHYTPDGGTVSVRWASEKDAPVLSVEDTGIGIPARAIPRLTERFYRVGSDRARQSGGTGLGLAIVKHVLNAHEARLGIESELGTGSTFRCMFPRERLVLRNASHARAEAQAETAD